MNNYTHEEPRIPTFPLTADDLRRIADFMDEVQAKITNGQTHEPGDGDWRWPAPARVKAIFEPTSQSSDAERGDSLWRQRRGVVLLTGPLDPP